MTPSSHGPWLDNLEPTREPPMPALSPYPPVITIAAYGSSLDVLETRLGAAAARVMGDRPWEATGPIRATQEGSVWTAASIDRLPQWRGTLDITPTDVTP